MTLYIVVAYRLGQADKYSYVVGVFSDFIRAKTEADNHDLFRGGIYKCAVEECALDQVDHESGNYTKELYRSLTS